jgi:hypothetical protein
VTGGWRKLDNEEFHNLYSSPDINRMIKSRRMRWVVHVARMGEMRNAYEIFIDTPEGKRPLGMPRCRWRIILKWFLGKCGWRVWIRFIWLRIWTGRGLL